MREEFQARIDLRDVQGDKSLDYERTWNMVALGQYLRLQAPHSDEGSSEACCRSECIEGGLLRREKGQQTIPG